MGEFLGQMMGGLAQLLGLAEGASGGDLSVMLAELENAGLSERVRSWMGHGENLPVTPEELAAAFPPEQLQAWASKAGTTPQALLEILAEALPRVVERTTPKDKPPAD
jgi:uncharacterized protein YidB (DUF937 family)